jgi:hypothetical protein
MLGAGKKPLNIQRMVEVLGYSDRGNKFDAPKPGQLSRKHRSLSACSKSVASSPQRGEEQRMSPDLGCAARH